MKLREDLENVERKDNQGGIIKKKTSGDITTSWYEICYFDNFPSLSTYDCESLISEMNMKNSI